MSKRKLLLADDSVTIQKVVNLTFADEGIDVLTVGDGDAAMQQIADDLPDIVLADVNMPGPTGYQICESIRQNEATKHIPVILLVGSFEPFDEAEAARVGANSYLTKPFQSIRQLVTQVSELIAASVPVSAPQPEPEPSPEPEPPAQQFVQIPPIGIEQPPVVEPSQASSSSQLESFREDRLATMASEPAYAQPVPGLETFETTPVETQAETPKPEADDIENLYRQSVTDQNLSNGSDFGDIGIDDEMIETSYASSENDRVYLDPEYHAEEPLQTFVEETHEPASQFETSGETPIEEQFHGQNVDVSRAPVAETHYAETERLDPSVAAAMASESVEQIEQPPASSSEHDFAATIPVFNAEKEPVQESRIGEETIRMESRFDTTGSGTFEFDEINLLDLPSPESGNTVEVTTPLNAIEKGSNLQVVSLAPELIEMIAQRVVEKMTEKY